MRKLLHLYFVVSSIFLIVSCEKFIINKDDGNTPENNFELLWKKVDENYSFFELKGVNWDSIYRVYRPEIHNNISDQALFKIMADMLHELRDGHVNLYSDFDQSRNLEWYSGFPANFSYTLLADNYLVNDFKRTDNFIIKNFDSVGYILSETFAGNIESGEIDDLIDHLSEMKGIIFDIRNNSGGLSKNSEIVSSRFADHKRLVSYTLYKSGPGHNDFTPPQPNYVSPAGNRQYTQQVVLLTNRRTYSAANDFVISMSAFPHVTIMGDSTGGGGGTPYDYELFNGWRFRIPKTQTLSPEGFNIENGITPDIEVNMRTNDINRGIDTILEAAIEYINAGT